MILQNVAPVSLSGAMLCSLSVHRHFGPFISSNFHLHNLPLLLGVYEVAKKLRSPAEKDVLILGGNVQSCAFILDQPK